MADMSGMKKMGPVEELLASHRFLNEVLQPNRCPANKMGSIQVLEQ